VNEAAGTAPHVSCSTPDTSFCFLLGLLGFASSAEWLCMSSARC